MAYNSYPYNNPYLYQQLQQPYQVSGQQQSMQIQNGGFVSVQNENEARSYPVAPGNSVTFRDETSPYIYTKTMGFSQLDQPIFEKYRLVKEEIAESAPTAATATATIDNSAQKKLEGQIERLWKEINALKENRRPSQKKEIKNE